MPDIPLLRQFWAAVGAGDESTVRRLAAAGADVNGPVGNSGGETPLIRAVTTGDLVMVKVLLDLGADVNLPCKGPGSRTPLMFALEQPDILDQLLVAGADLASRTTADTIRHPSGQFVLRPGGETALHLACASGNATAVRKLLRAGANPEARTDDGRTPLDCALQLGAATEAATALVEAGAQLTPERLERMHSAAHNPNADLIGFPCEPGVGARSVPAKTGEAPGEKPDHGLPTQSTSPPPEFRCPNCQALIYSRKPKICGQCGAALPPELLVSDLEAQQMRNARAWARELADKFGNKNPPAAPSVHVHSILDVEESSREAVSPQDLLRGISCVEEFRYRRRPSFYLYLLGCVGFCFPMVFLIFKLKWMSPEPLPFVIFIFGLLCWRDWQRANPICPNCKQNIRFCAAVYCHVCGRPLRGGRCEQCGVDNSSFNIFQRYSGPGNLGWITYCPGCAARLEAKVSRWRLGSKS